jgi:peptidoglycan/xylan/chitin deacetylase (PgdA/CDA1 family)
MRPGALWKKIRRHALVGMADTFAKRPVKLGSPASYITFTFDDFPKSAYIHGGAILKKFGLQGTFYVSMGMMNRKSPSGEIAGPELLRLALDDGHELGCHTYDHLDAWDTSPGAYEKTIIKNRHEFSKILPGVAPRTFAYPYANATPGTKQVAARYFDCCRGGPQSANVGVADFNYLNACFLDRRKSGESSSIREMIDANRRTGGWLIFATHDIDEKPSPYGCTPHFFEEIVNYAVASGSRILPAVTASEAIRGCNNHEAS